MSITKFFLSAHVRSVDVDTKFSSMRERTAGWKDVNSCAVDSGNFHNELSWEMKDKIIRTLTRIATKKLYQNITKILPISNATKDLPNKIKTD